MVGNLFQQLMVDEQWSIRRERGFSWWSYRLAQHIDVLPPVHSAGLDLCVLRIWTDVAHNVDPATNPAAILAQINTQSTLNALVWNPRAATIAECCTVTVHQDNAGWISKVLATAAILQNASAYARAQPLAQALRAVPSMSNHPTSGQRPNADDMLHMPAQVVVPTGAEPSKFVGPISGELSGFLAEYGDRLQWFGNADETGATIEVPFTGSRPLAFQKPGAPDTRLETALVQVITGQPHPEAGNGALIVTRLPMSPGPERAPTLANELNLAEAAGDVNAAPLLGAWCPDFLSENGNGLAFCSFIPNLLAQPGILNNWVLYQRTRSLFARQFLGI